MRRVIQLAAYIYPQRRRERYGEEFDALIQDVGPSWREFTDVTRGALKMQMTNAATHLRLAVVGFTGILNAPLEFVPERTLAGLAAAPPGDPGSAAATANFSAPSIFTPLREQLGIQLKSAKGPLEVLVIDRVEMPSED